MKKRMVAIMLSMAMVFTGIPVSAADSQEEISTAVGETKSSAFEEYLESKYIDPDRVYSSDVRWWLGSASATDETLLEEIQALYDGGFRGVELCMQSDGVASDADYAYGSEMWSHKWKLMMNKLLDLGMGVYLTSGTNWSSSNVPESYLKPTEQGALQIVAMPQYDGEDAAKEVILNAGETVSEDLQTPSAVRENCELLAVYAYEIDSNGEFLYGTDTDLMKVEGAVTKTGKGAADYTLNWTAPAKGEQGADARFMVIPLWTQGAYETSSPATEPCYTTNYFDKRGVEALKKFWEDHYLDDPQLNEKIKAGDVQLFMDSLELGYGDGFTWWCEDALEEFQARKGYDILPYLFLINGVGKGFGQAGDPYYQTKGVYDLADNGTLREKIINDWQDVMTQLYEENMLVPLKEWLNSMGIKTRAQISYGKAFEITEPSQYVDYPEAENLNQYNQIDMFRLHTAGAKLENKVLSTETGGTSQVYGTSTQRLLKDVYSEYAAGFQRVIWHIWTAGYGYGNYKWPGYMSGFGGGTAFYRWGTREPSYQDYDEFNSHIGRIQQLMQTGKARTDIGFVHNNWAQGLKSGGESVPPTLSAMNWQFAHQGVYYRSTELQDNGYTYDYFSPDFLFNENVTFNEDTKTIESAGYKALVLYQEWLDIVAAKKILELAEEGLPVVIIDGAAIETTFNDGKDQELADIMDQMKSLPNVKVAKVNDGPVDYSQADGKGYDDEVYNKLQELGVSPYAEFEGANHQLLTQSRMDEGGNMYLYAYNYCPNDYHQNSILDSVVNEDHGTNIQTEIKMDGRFIPYSIDSWTGEVTELAQYRYEDGQTIFPIDLDYGNIALYAFEAVDEEKVSILSTNADSSYATENGPVIRATKTGEYRTTLNTGDGCTNQITVPDSYDIKDWDVTVTSWTGNPEEGDLVRSETIGDLTTVNRKTSTVKTDINVKLNTLTTWDNIPEVGKDVSGEGHYKAVFQWDADQASGAYIDFGDSLDQSMKVWINGKKVGGEVAANPTKVKKDVGGNIDNGKGEQVPLEGNDLYTGGVDWNTPIADVSSYLVDGENTIEIEYHSNLTNVLLNNGVIQPKFFGQGSGWNALTWWGNDVDYRAYGPKQAKVVPYVDVQVKSTAQGIQEELDKANQQLADAKNQLEEATKRLEEARKQSEADSKAVQQALATVQIAEKRADEAEKKLAKLTFTTQRPKIKTVRSTKKKTVKITWKKVKGAGGYQIQYSTKSNMKKAKYVTLKKGSITSKTMKKLKSKKKIYMRVRAYKTIDGKKVYTGYSPKKSVKVK